MKSIFSNIKNWIKVKTGNMRCSGYKVYPGGYKCPGCSDCVGKNKISPYVDMP